jgi:uncharacterized protein involved in exopolysaccharide biosynthesis
MGVEQKIEKKAGKIWGLVQRYWYVVVGVVVVVVALGFFGTDAP